MKRAVQLLKRVRMESEITLTGGIMRFKTMIDVLRENVTEKINVADGEMIQFTTALGAATLALQRLEKIGDS